LTSLWFCLQVEVGADQVCVMTAVALLPPPASVAVMLQLPAVLEAV
jgi:hypothetical protein